ncbi:MAG: S-layer homology domain-containing protein [Chloroflexota bacterium]
MKGAHKKDDVGWRTAKDMVEADEEGYAFAAINTDYFGHDHNQEGTTYINGKLISDDRFTIEKGVAIRTSLAISKDNEFNIGFHKVSETEGFNINPINGEPYFTKEHEHPSSFLYNVTGGGPQIVKDGVYKWTWEYRTLPTNEQPNGVQLYVLNNEKFDDRDWGDGSKRWPFKSSRYSIAGLTRGGSQLILAANTTPTKLKELVEPLITKLGLYNAIRLDGGGSSQLHFDGRYLTESSDAKDRVVPAGLVIYRKAPASSQFCDVPPNHAFFYEIVDQLAKRETTVGYSDGSFRPDDELSRAELATMILRAMGLKVPGDPSDPNAFRFEPSEEFPDVKPLTDTSAPEEYRTTHYGAITALKRLDIIPGYPDGNFKPDEKVTRAQIAKFIRNARRMLLQEETCDDTRVRFPDVYVSEDDDLARAIACLSNSITSDKQRVISGYPDGTFRPSNNVTRGEAAKFIANGLLDLTSQVGSQYTSACEKFEELEREEFLVPHGNLQQRCIIVLGYSNSGASNLANAASPTQNSINSISIREGHVYEAIAYLGPNSDIKLQVLDSENNTVAQTSGLAKEGQTSVRWTATSSSDHRILIENHREFAQEGTNVRLDVREIRNYEFADVLPSHKYYTAIRALLENEIIKGDTNSGEPRFRPDDPIERDDVIVILARWLYQYTGDQYELLPPPTGIFNDLDGNGEVIRAVELAHRDGIVNGLNATTFGHDQSAERENALVFLMRALRRHVPTDGTTGQTKIDNADVNMAIGLGITGKDSEVRGWDNDAWNQPVTRGQFAYWMCNAILGRSSCGDTGTSDPVALRRLRNKAKAPRGDDAVCFSASNTAYIPKIIVPFEGAIVCYRGGDYMVGSQDGTVSDVYTYRANPSDHGVCGDSQLISMEARPFRDKVHITLRRCDFTAFRSDGTAYLQYGERDILEFPVRDGRSRVTLTIDPVQQPGIVQKGPYRIALLSDNDLNGNRKYTGDVRIWPVYEPQAKDYEYTTDSREYRCGGQYAHRLTRSSNHNLYLRLTRCNYNKRIGRNGHFNILVNGVKRYGPFHFEADDWNATIYLDPYGDFGENFGSGTHTFQSELHFGSSAYRTGTARASVEFIHADVPNQTPIIAFQKANNNDFPDGILFSNQTKWVFTGTAADIDGTLSSIEARCPTCPNGTMTGATSWEYTINNMTGLHPIYFKARDNEGESTTSRKLDLYIDAAPPTTSVSLDGETNASRWPTWFNKNVKIQFNATDGASGRAKAGIKEIQYRLNNGLWNTIQGSTHDLYIGDDGHYTLEYKAIDKVGNEEPIKTISFQIDQTPPTGISGVAESKGVVSGQWQKTQQIPAFSWAESSDAMSGLSTYQFYFGTNPIGESYQAFGADAARQWTPKPGGVGTGTYYLRGRTRDNAKNWSDWATLFTYRYDATPPKNPTEATHLWSIQNDIWQRETAMAAFRWNLPFDRGSGVKGSYIYWGTDPDGESGEFTTEIAYNNPPLCETGQVCTGYLRMKTVDNVDNEAEEWSTAFVLRYDDVPPVANFTINEGVTQTAQSLVVLDIDATDEGSGVYEMRLSNDGERWSEWEAYSTTREWQIPAISRQEWSVFLQVRDLVGLESEVVSRTISFDVNVNQPKSVNFRLFDHNMSAGAGEHTSATYMGRSTVGQVPDSAQVNSQRYIITGGYEASSQAIPLVVPGHDEFLFINGVFASGVVADTMKSPRFQMIGTYGEPALPNNETTLTSGTFTHQPGFLAARPSVAGETAVPEVPQEPGPEATPPPAPDCEFPLVSIDDGSVYTNATAVQLSLCAPYAVEMLVSNDGGFGDATWEPYSRSRSWTLTTHGQNVLPRFVYVAFRDEDGSVHGTYFDEIIYDPAPPSGAIATTDVPIDEALFSQVQATSLTRTGATANIFIVDDVRYIQRIGDQALAQPLALLNSNAANNVELYILADDDNSGVAQMQLSENADFSDSDWEPVSALRPYRAADGEDGQKTVYARFRDTVGNESDASETSFVVDTQAPTGGMAISPKVVGPENLFVTLMLDANDGLSGVSDMRIATEPTFADSPWMAYSGSYDWPLDLDSVFNTIFNTSSDSAQNEQTLYIQFRDAAGNVSEIQSDTFTVDTVPPLLLAEVAGTSDDGQGPNRTVTITATDVLADVQTVWMSNDPLMQEEVKEVDASGPVTWEFTDSNVAWLQAADSVGNVTSIQPAYLSANVPLGPPITITPTPTPKETPTPTETPTETPTPGETPEPTGTPEPTPGPSTLEPGNIYLPMVRN